MTRRETMVAAAAMGAAVATGKGAAMAATDAGTKAPSAAIGKRELKPLPFSPAKLKGLSERLLRSHHENNYGGAVKNLVKVEQELARATRDSPAFVVSGLRERELTFYNSMVLHELYFANLGGSGKAGGAVEKAIAEAFGGFGQWEGAFRATAAGLGGGSGWVVLDFNLHTGELRTSWSGHHTQTLAWSAPLLVLDMYEHSYQMDYGAAAAKYVDAFFQNIHWEEVNRRHEAALKAYAVLRA